MSSHFTANKLVDRRLTGGLALALFCCSCGWFGGEISDEEVNELHQDMRAQKRTTVFDNSLRQFGRLLKAYYVPQTPVQSKNIGNATAEKNVPSDLYTMVASAVNKIGHQVIFVPFDAQYVISEATTGGNITRLYPKVVISGGITGFDKDMFEKEREVEAAGGWAGAQAGGHIDASGQYSRVTVDLNMLDYKTQSYFPGVISSNSILLERNSLGWGIYGYYMGNGASFDYDLKKKQGVHAALRTLVEFSVIEVLGKYFRVPYWKCIPGAKADEGMISMMRENFMDKSNEEQGIEIKKLLFLNGVNGLDRDSHIFKGEEDSALRDAMRKYRVSNMSDLYIALWNDVPIDKAMRRVSIDIRRKAEEARKKVEEEKRLAADKAAEEEKKRQEAAKEYQLKIKSYNASVAEGDRLYRAGKLKEAEQQYKEAHRLFGGETYPVQMLNTIYGMFQQKKAEEEKYNLLLSQAEQLFKNAEQNDFSFINYKKALTAYEQALKTRPGNKHVSDQISYIKNRLKKYSTVIQSEGAGDW